MKRIIKKGKEKEILIFTCKNCGEVWETNEWEKSRTTGEISDFCACRCLDLYESINN